MCLLLFSHFKEIGFCDILNNQNLGKWFLPWPLAGLITLTPTLIILDITKTLSNNCLLLYIVVTICLLIG